MQTQTLGIDLLGRPMRASRLLLRRFSQLLEASSTGARKGPEIPVPAWGVLGDVVRGPQYLLVVRLVFLVLSDRATILQSVTWLLAERPLELTIELASIRQTLLPKWAGHGTAWGRHAGPHAVTPEAGRRAVVRTRSTVVG